MKETRSTVKERNKRTTVRIGSSNDVSLCSLGRRRSRQVQGFCCRLLVFMVVALVVVGVAGPVQASDEVGSAPVQAQVSYRNRLLTIEAHGSSLREVLDIVHDKTGIRFEGLQDADEPVAVQLGPAPVAVVLKALLENVPFDYF